jgi:integrase
LGEATPARIDAAIRSMRTAHGPTMARQSKTLLRGALQLAVMANALGANPVRDLQPIGLKHRPKGATALTADQLRKLLAKLRADDYCQQNDLVDPITVLIATGLRRSELLALRWTDFDETTATLTVAGKVVRVAGEGLQRIDDTKSDAGRRTIPLPRFAVEVLRERRTPPVSERVAGDLPLDGRHPARSEQPGQAVAQSARRARHAGRDHPLIPQDGGDADRRGRPLGTRRRRSPWARQGVDDAGPLHVPWAGP